MSCQSFQSHQVNRKLRFAHLAVFVLWRDVTFVSLDDDNDDNYYDVQTDCCLEAAA